MAEAIKLERYVEQAKLLMKYKADTWDQFFTLTGAIQGEIDALADQRKELYRQKRREPQNEPLSPHSIHQSIHPNVQAGVTDLRPDRSRGPRHPAKNPRVNAHAGKGEKAPFTPPRQAAPAVRVFAPAGGYSAALSPVKAKMNRPAPSGAGRALTGSGRRSKSNQGANPQRTSGMARRSLCYGRATPATGLGG